MGKEGKRWERKGKGGEMRDDRRGKEGKVMDRGMEIAR